MSYYFHFIVPCSNASYGVWCNGRYNYLGIRIPVTGGFLFAWVRLSSEIRIDAYALQSSVVGITEYEKGVGTISVYPSQANSFIQVTSSNYQLKEIKVIDVLGMEVIGTKEKDIDVNTLQGGIYFIKAATPKEF